MLWLRLTHCLCSVPASVSVFCVLMIFLLSLMCFSPAGNANSGAVIRNHSAPHHQQAKTSNNGKPGRQITWTNANAQLLPRSVQNLCNVSSSLAQKTDNFSGTEMM